MKIAIDGPAGAGKSTVARLVAERLGLRYLDTGAMYRAAAYCLLGQGVDVRDADAVGRAVKDLDIRVEYREGKQRMLAGGKDITDFLRTPEVSRGASDVGVSPAVRLRLAEMQREVARQYDVVMDGRDIGTYVLPDADKKFYITATAEERARRRLKEAPESGTLAEVRAQIEARDHTDSHRAFAPLRQAEDAVYVDTTDMTVEEVVARVLTAIEEN